MQQKPRTSGNQWALYGTFLGSSHYPKTLDMAEKWRVSVEGKELDDIFTCCRTKLLATPTTESLLPNLQRR
jgi:hypothetical protein